MDQRYLNAKKYFEAQGIDTEAALEKIQRVPLSLHCWQLNDVEGFGTDGAIWKGGGDELQRQGIERRICHSAFST